MSTSYVSRTGRITFAAGSARIIPAITSFGISHDVANLLGAVVGGGRHLGPARSPRGSEA